MYSFKNRQIVFIDAGVENRQQLLAGIPDDADVRLLSGTANGLQQIAVSLADDQDVAALHIISHGAPGKLYLGNAAITTADLDKQQAAL